VIDPITALAVAANAFGTVKRMVSAGREIEDTLGQIGRFYGAVSDLAEHKRRAENPPLFKKLVATMSVNEEAMEIYARTKKTQQMERELRELLLYTFGQNGYQELVDLRRSVAAQREKTVYLQERRRKAFFWNTIQISGILVMAYSCYFVFSFIIGASNGNS
tara:strand:+ start:1686 stop:2171 length:486 start_codon:yes stop_codon:yes gene_type:complete